MAAELARRGMDMGCFVGTLVYDRPTFVVDDPDERERLLKELHTTLEVAKRMNGKWITTLGGYQDLRLPRSYQNANMIENLKWCGEVAERAGVTLLIESVNSQGWPGTFLTSIADAYLVVRAVNSPAVKLVFDVYHVQLEDGDLIQNIDRCWAEIAYFHLADNPGRLEPGTGEINFQNLLRHIQAKGYTGILDMEHGNSKPGKAGEQAVIDTYLALDQF
jgi:hydroxypyruvate isomerase